MNYCKVITCRSRDTSNGMELAGGTKDGKVMDGIVKLPPPMNTNALDTGELMESDWTPIPRQ